MIDNRTAPYAALVLRVSLGVMYIAHSLVLKHFTYTLPGTAQFFESLGLPAALAYVVLLCLVVRRAWRALSSSSRWLVGAAAGTLAYFAQQQVLFPIADFDVVAWLVAGVVVASSRPPAPARRIPAITVALTALAVVAGVAGALDIAADRRAAAALEGDGDPLAAANLRPDAVRYRLVASRAFEREGRRGDALAQLDRADDLSPRDPVVRREQGRLLLDRARSTSIPADIEVAVRFLAGLAAGDPNNAETQLRLGLARALAGDERGAETAWLRAERLAPSSAAASTNLAVAYARAGRTSEARAAAERALVRDPDEPRAAAVLAELDGT